MWRVDFVVAITAQQISRVIVAQNQQDIGSLRRHVRLLCVRDASPEHLADSNLPAACTPER
jgi:hypothetical protein